MNRALPAALAVAVTLSGCVAAVVPIAASGIIGKRQLQHRRAAKATLKALDRSEPPATKVTLLPPGSVLPPPTGTTAATSTPAIEPGGWRALLRHAARSVVQGDPDCAGRPPAVLIDAAVADAPAAERDTAVSAINAFGTMGIAVVFIGEADRGAALSAAGFGASSVGETLFRSADAPGLAARYCIAAIGTTRADEPWSTALPAKAFLLPGGGTQTVHAN